VAGPPQAGQTGDFALGIAAAAPNEMRAKADSPALMLAVRATPKSLPLFSPYFHFLAFLRIFNSEKQSLPSILNSPATQQQLCTDGALQRSHPSLSAKRGAGGEFRKLHTPPSLS